MTSHSSAAAELFESVDSLYQRGTRYQLEYDYTQAIPLLNAVIKANPNHVQAVAQLAMCLRMTGRPRLALTTFKLALRLAPGHPELLQATADCYKDMGDFDKAVTHYEQALKTKPDMAECLHSLTLLQEPSLQSAVVKSLQGLHNRLDKADPARITVCFALGSVYERHKEHRRAFACYEEGNRLQFARLGYNEAAQFARFDEVESFFNADFFARLKSVGHPDPAPIFIVGMPRSGSTLVEQILASHPQVYGVGEDDVLPRVVGKLIPNISGKLYPHAIDALPPPTFAPLGEHVLAQLRGLCPEPHTRIASKTLINFFHIGFIRLLLPNATIIHCVRDPMDTCWSIYRQLFTGSFAYCYDQTALGRYYRRYQQLMRHWHEVLPGAVYDISYEELVTQPEPAIRALLKHCRLPWEKNCLASHRTERPVSTASLRQVRRPIYTSAIKSWEHVANHLAPLQAILEG